MNPTVLTRIFTLCLLAALLAPLQLLAQKPIHYEVTDLGTLGGTISFVSDVNDSGQVDGESTLPGDIVLHGFLWDRGVRIDLGTLGGPNSRTFFKMDARREITGFSDTSLPDPLGEDFCGFQTNLKCLPFVWRHGRMIPLPILDGNNGVGDSSNNRGQVVGISETAIVDATCPAPEVLQYRPVVWTNGKIQELRTFPGDPDGEAIVINDLGAIVGRSGDCANPNFHMLLWRNAEVTDLGNLGGVMGHTPMDLNNRGQVVGFSNLPGDEVGHAFLWEDGRLTDLGTLPGDALSSASGINSKGQIVGISIDADNNSRPFLWEDGIMIDLTTLISPDSSLVLLDAAGINARGQIAGTAFDTNTGEIHGYLATPRDGGIQLSTWATKNSGRRLKPVLSEHVRTLLGRTMSLRFSAVRKHAPSFH